jgi:Immunoglobulin I-set domain
MPFINNALFYLCRLEEEKQELVADGRHVIMAMDGENYSLKLAGLTRVDSGFYRCIATNDFGQSTQDCEINVKCAPQLTQKLADTKLTEGDANVVLSVKVNSYPEPKVTW